MSPKECDNFPSNVYLKDPLLLKNPSSGGTTTKKPPPVYDFLAVFVVLLAATTWVEAQASHNTSETITDAGFVITEKLHQVLVEDRNLNDWLALINSVALFIPLFYSFLVTTMTGDYELIFRITSAQVLRSLCGYVTHIAPDAKYLASNYDYPDIIHCCFQDCSGPPQVMPFISFFSGHVTNLVICGNDIWLRFPRHKWAAYGVHALNVFQIVRMLATRGHYTIDLLMGWVVAVYFTTGAGKLGRAYTRGTPLIDLLPRNLNDAWYVLTGIGQLSEEMEDAKYNLRRKEIEELLLSVQGSSEDDDMRTETTWSTGSYRSDGSQ